MVAGRVLGGKGDVASIIVTTGERRLRSVRQEYASGTLEMV
jgi:hypothetical protein